MSESEPRFVPLEGYPAPTPEELVRRARDFRTEMLVRRTVREFSSTPVPREVIEECIRVAGSAPNGANRQPWHFVAVGPERDLRRRIREGAEEEEEAFYSGRAPDEWLEALAHLGTDAEKPFLEEAPWLVVVFAESYGVADDGSRTKNYYVQESVGIATGFLIAALHKAGLATLTHTPSPMGFLNEILDRPENERPFLILVAGYPAEGAVVPDIDKKPLSEITTFIEG